MLQVFKPLHDSYSNHITSAGHLMLLLLGLRIGTRTGWVWICLAIAAISLMLWSLNFRRARAVADTPTSNIASAPQGYVELSGVARSYPGQKVTCPVSARTCVWYRYLIEEESRNGWYAVDRGTSEDSFLIEDASGEALIDPDWAEVLTDHRRRWTEQSRRYTEWLLVPGERLYVIGEFATVGGRNAVLDEAADVGDLLAQWKADKAQLKARFDLDNNGEIDVREWQLARQAARREIAKLHDQIRTQPGVNMVRKPRDGRHFVISNLDPTQLARRYGRWTLIQLAIAVLAGMGVLAALSARIA